MNAFTATGRVTGGTFAQATSQFVGWGDGDLNPLGSTTLVGRSIGPAGLASRLYWRITADGISGASNSTLTSLKAGSAGGQLITVAGSTAPGDHSDLSGTDSWVLNDSVCMKEIVGAGGTTIAPSLFGMCYQTGTRDTNHTWISSNHSISAAGTNFYNWTGQRQTTTETSPDVRLVSRIAAVMRRFTAQVSTASHTVAVTLKDRLNTADGGLSFTINNGSGTGEFGDLTNTTTIIPGDLYDSSLTTASGSGVFAATTTYVDSMTFDHTQQMCSANVNGTAPWTVGATYYDTFQSKLGANTTESVAQMAMQVPTVSSKAEFYASANTSITDATITQRINAGAGGQTMTITAGVSGAWVNDLSGTTTYLATDQGNWQTVVPAGGTQIMAEFLSSKMWLAGPGSLTLSGAGA